MVARDNPDVPATAPEPVKVRTTMRPWEEIEVSPDEAASLRRIGVLYGGPPVTEADYDPRNDPQGALGAKTSPAGKAGKDTKETGQ